MDQQPYVLVSAPNLAGERFLEQLRLQGVPFAAIVNNAREFARVSALGVETTIVVNTNDEKTWMVPGVPVGRIFLFENSLNLCCRYIQICRHWTTKPIYVITGSHNPRLVYKGLGANYVIHSSGKELAFLIKEER